MGAYRIESPALQARQAAERKAARRKRGKRILAAVLAIVAAVFWLLGYGQGYLDAWNGRATVFQSHKES